MKVLIIININYAPYTPKFFVGFRRTMGPFHTSDGTSNQREQTPNEEDTGLRKHWVQYMKEIIGNPEVSSWHRVRKRPIERNRERADSRQVGSLKKGSVVE